MRLETGNQMYDGFEQIAETMQECPVDLEYSLPDYCADIQKILKCAAVPEVTSAVVTGDSLSVEGNVDIRVLYLDAKGNCVRGFDTKKDFSASIRLSGSADGTTAVVRPAVQHMNCRAMNARRIDLHITLGLTVSVSGVRHISVADSVSLASVETRCREYPVSRAVGCCTHTFILDENMALQNGKPPVETILRRSIQYRVDSVQAGEGEITIAGRACVEVLYRSFQEQSLPERMLFELPFTETVDCAGADALCTVQVQYAGGECSIQPREDSVGEYTVFNIYLKPCFVLKLYKSGTVTAVCDAFATRGILAAKYKNIQLEHLEQGVPRTLRVRDTVRIPENDLERVLDIWCDGLTLSAYTEKESPMIRGKFTVCLLYLTTEKRIAYAERLFDFTEAGTNLGEGRLSAAGEIHGIKFAVTDSGVLECTAELQIREQLRQVHTVRVLESAELDETEPDESCCAAVCYAQPGDSLWEIAKRYRAPLSGIRTYNHGVPDTLEAPAPLIICRK